MVLCGLLLQVSMDTSSIQYESDQMMKGLFGSDYGIACCVSAMRIGKDMQFFGARCNLPKLLLYTMNGGKDEVTGDQAGPAFPALKSGDGPLQYDEVVNRLDEGMAWLAKLYCNTMNVIHFMHDKYDYERIQVGCAWIFRTKSFTCIRKLGAAALLCPAQMVGQAGHAACNALVMSSS